MNLTKNTYNYLLNSCKEFEEKTHYDIDVNEVLYSYFNRKNDNIDLLYDWDEQDQKHIVPFIKEMIKIIEK